MWEVNGHKAYENTSKAQMGPRRPHWAQWHSSAQPALSIICTAPDTITQHTHIHPCAVPGTRRALVSHTNPRNSDPSLTAVTHIGQTTISTAWNWNQGLRKHHNSHEKQTGLWMRPSSCTSVQAVAAPEIQAHHSILRVACKITSMQRTAAWLPLGEKAK